MSCIIVLSCTKEELSIEDKPLEIDENSEEYQKYMAERAREYILTYRFEKVQDVLGKVQDAQERKRLTELLAEYRAKAAQDAFYFVTDQNDSLFFLDPKVTDAATRTSLTLDFVGTPPFSGPLFNTKGILHGFKRFPKLTDLEIANSAGTGIAEIAFLTDLEHLKWYVDRYVMEQQFPEEEFVPTPLVADFSKNAKLRYLSFRGIDSRNLVFPPFQLENVTFNQSDVNANDNLNTVKTKTLSIINDKVSNPGFVLKNNDIDKLSISADTYMGAALYYSQIRSLDIKETKIKELIANGANNLESVVLNEGLEKLEIQASQVPGVEGFTGNLRTVSEYPTSLKHIVIGAKDLNNKDFSKLNQLEYLYLAGADQDYNNLSLPVGLKAFFLMEGQAGNLNFSNSTGLKELMIMNIRGLSKLDVSSSGNLSRLNVHAPDVNELILPPDLTPYHFLNLHTLGYSSDKYEELTEEEKATIELYLPIFVSIYFNIKVKQGCTIMNYLDWMQAYITYYD
jgi:hypothetical protein